MNKINCFKHSPARAIITPVIASVAFSASAGGIFLQETVEANAGTAGAGAGVYTDSAAALWTNPATMSSMGKIQSTVNTLLYDLKMNYRDDNGLGDAKSQDYTPVMSFFHAHKLTNNIHAGIAIAVTGGAEVTYGDNWAGAGDLDSIRFNVTEINPALSYKIDKQWSVGVGAQVSVAKLDQDSTTMRLDSDRDITVGFNAGVLYHHTDNLDFGLSYRSNVKHDFRMDTAFKGPLGLTGETATTIDMPAITHFSTRWGISEDINLYGTIEYQEWSKWDQSISLITSGEIEISNTIERHWSNVWQFAVGTDYRMSDDWLLKAGIAYDSSPLDDASRQWVDMPTGKLWRYSVGLATEWDNTTTLDFFYQYMDIGTNAIDVEGMLNPIQGQFSGRMHFIGVNYTF